ncbi:DUF1538 domain-containing protein [Anaerocolumna xylanovorans]|uniref:DUF1538 domain-containing protein n=1 Tax=Anaerocolumna xylanovorans DSM 12503 TaxID=1121345 RepID=A0A1M7Y0G7_9FIRM|nr:DUF1538 domain-containing protein [Anaerocolumna xylanovorans]SHO45035.1 Protein of unknown function [Anaerocolumna xylanovorans DSM 12503]
MKTLRTLKEVFLSSLPLAIIIIVICVFVAPLENPHDYIKLTVGYASVVFGQAFFLIGLDSSILPVGKLVGSSLAKFNKGIFVILFGVLFGILATVAEPALVVLARQTHMIMNGVNETVFVWILSTGVGIFVGLALYRVVKDMNIKVVFVILYILIFLTVIFVPEEFVALAFDGSGATTGDISVPFILALGMGISATMSKRKTNDDIFGIIGIASVGPILAVFIYGIVMKIMYGGEIPAAGVYDPGASESFVSIILSNISGVALALIPIVAVFLPFQLFVIKLPKKQFKRILLGIAPVYIGLLIFLSGIDYGFAFAAKYIGEIFLNGARPEWFKWLLLPLGFVLGVAITLSEPAVTVLGEQLEEITNGHIKKLTIRITLAIGIGFASLLSMAKILTQVNILWFLIPLYALALIMMLFTSSLFVGLAFDSGGVTGGALTSAFLTPLTLGTAQAVASTAGAKAQSVLTNGFGIIAFISVTPLIAVQALGIIYDRKVKQALKINAEYENAEYEELFSYAAQMDMEEEADMKTQNDMENETDYVGDAFSAEGCDLEQNSDLKEVKYE